MIEFARFVMLQLFSAPVIYILENVEFVV